MPFPTTSLLDNFNRPNQGPPPSSNWSGPIIVADNGLIVMGNQCRGNSGVNSNSGYWSNSTFGPDTECYITIPYKDDGENVVVFARLASPNSSADGYAAHATIAAGTDVLRAYRIDNEVFTQLGSSLSQEITNGDKLGIETIGSSISVYRHNGSSWVQELTRTDSAYSAAGYIGLRIENDKETQLDDFSGGTVVTPGKPGKTKKNITYPSIHQLRI